MGLGAEIQERATEEVQPHIEAILKLTDDVTSDDEERHVVAIGGVSLVSTVFAFPTVIPHVFTKKQLWHIRRYCKRNSLTLMVFSQSEIKCYMTKEKWFPNAQS